MHVFLIGGTGFISSRIVDRLRRERHTITTFTRGTTPAPTSWSSDIEICHGDRSHPADLKQAIAGRSFDVVIDMAAYTPEDSVAAIDAISGRCGLFVHCSTISVYMVSDEVTCPVTEDQDRLPPMPHWPRNPFGMDYGLLKRGCEDVLWRAHEQGALPVTMLRPTYVGGPGDPAGRDWFWIERILDEKPILVPGSGDFAFQNVFVDDVADVFVRLIDAGITPGTAYNVASEEFGSLNEYIRLLGELLGREVDLVHVDQRVFDELPLSTYPGADVFPYNTRRTAVFSLDRVKADLGFLATPLKTWLEPTISHFVGGPSSAGYEFRSAEVDFAERWRSACGEMTASIGT